MIMLMLRILLFAASAAGWLVVLNKKYDVAAEFAPAIYCSGCSGVLFFAGIWNLLPEAAAAITIGGLLCAAWAVWKKVRLSRRTWWVAAGFGAALLYFAWLHCGEQFTETDSFTHWALIIRELLVLDRMPNFSDGVILFQAYPMGSALWVYYVCRVAGWGESFFLFAQQIMLLSFILPIFAWVTKEKWHMAVLAVGYSVFALCANIPVNELMVDSLMPMAAVALFCIGSCYREEKALWCAMPLLVFLMQVKNSGVFFAAAILACFLVFRGRELLARRSLGYRFLTLDVLVPFASFLLWQKHVDLVFPFGDESLHAMSTANFANTVSEKTAEDIRQICLNIWTSATSLKNNTVSLMAFLTLVLIGLIVYDRCRRKEIKKWTALLCVDWAVYIVYVLGLLATYLFSMERAEALRLASFRRYLQSYGIFVYGITLAQIMRYGDLGRPGKGAAALCLVLALVPFWNPDGFVFRYPDGWKSLVSRSDNSDTTLTTVRGHTAEYGELAPYMSYYVYNGSEKSISRNYLVHVLRYELRSDKVWVDEDFDPFQGDIKSLGADYLYIWTSDEKSDAFLRENGLEKACGQSGKIINLMGLGS